MISIHKTRAYLVIIVTLIVLALLIGGIKYTQGEKQKKSQFVPPPAPISIRNVETQRWSSAISAVGTVFSDEGITVSAEVAGHVKSIHFSSGDTVEQGTLLITQDSASEIAQLDSAKAQLRLAESTFNRTKTLRSQGTVSASQYEASLQTLDSARADLQDIQSTLEKKTIKAPFSGRVGIRRVDLGQELYVGDAIVELQALNKLKVNFTVPQRWFSQLAPGLDVHVNMLELTDPVIKGVINAIDAKVDEDTRSIEVQAVLSDASDRLLPGMAVEVNVQLNDSSERIVVPVTAIVYAPFGNTVFVIEEDADSQQLKARQQFVKTGERRGDFVSITSGISANDRVATSGAFKLYDGQAVVITDKAETDYSLTPKPSDG